jgi:hypothetical protein
MERFNRPMGPVRSLLFIAHVRDPKKTVHWFATLDCGCHIDMSTEGDDKALLVEQSENITG